MKAFTKNQEVTYISAWSRKGAVIYRHAIVHSCGNKQMCLIDAESGEMMGRHFSPELGRIEDIDNVIGNSASGTFPRMTDEEAHAAALQASANVIAGEIARYEWLIERNADADHHYLNGLRKDLDEMRANQPAAMARKDAMAELKAKIK